MSLKECVLTHSSFDQKRQSKCLISNHAVFFKVYPDQSHSLPQVRQHQYLAMEDFLEATFHDNPSISRNEGPPINMDFNLDFLPSSPGYSQQKAKKNISNVIDDTNL